MEAAPPRFSCLPLIAPVATASLDLLTQLQATAHTHAHTHVDPAMPACAACAGDSDEDMSPAASVGDLPSTALARKGSYPSLNQAIRAMTKFGMSCANLAGLDSAGNGASPRSPAPTQGGACAAAVELWRHSAVQLLPGLAAAPGAAC